MHFVTKSALGAGNFSSVHLHRLQFSFIYFYLFLFIYLFFFHYLFFLPFHLVRHYQIKRKRGSKFISSLSVDRRFTFALGGCSPFI